MKNLLRSPCSPVILLSLALVARADHGGCHGNHAGGYISCGAIDRAEDWAACAASYNCDLITRDCANSNVINCAPYECDVSETKWCADDFLTKGECNRVSGCEWEGSSDSVVNTNTEKSCRRSRSCGSLSDSSCSSSYDCTFGPESCSTVSGQFGNAATSTSTCSRPCVSMTSRKCSELTTEAECTSNVNNNCVWKAGPPVWMSGGTSGGTSTSNAAVSISRSTAGLWGGMVSTAIMTLFRML